MQDAHSPPTVTCMTRRLTLAVLPLALLVASLAACAESARIPPPENSSAVEPLFASDEEALAAATEAYEEFLRVSGEILQDGGANPERLSPLVSAEVFASELEGFELFQASGYRATGSSTLQNTVLQQHRPGAAGQAEVQMYSCVFVGDVDVVDVNNQSVIDPNRPVLVEYEATFLSSAEGILRLEEETVWNGGGVCEQ